MPEPATSARLRPRMPSAAVLRSATRLRRSRMIDAVPDRLDARVPQGRHGFENLVPEDRQGRNEGRATEQERRRVDDRFVPARHKREVAGPWNDRAGHQQPRALLKQVRGMNSVRGKQEDAPGQHRVGVEDVRPEEGPSSAENLYPPTDARSWPQKNPCQPSVQARASITAETSATGTTRLHTRAAVSPRTRGRNQASLTAAGRCPGTSA